MPAQPASDDTAYVLRTSGSTGAPNGVVITHGSIRHYTESLITAGTALAGLFRDI